MNPMPELIIPEGRTRPVIVEIRHQYQVRCAEYLQYDQVDKELKSIIIAAVYDLCIISIHHKHSCFSNVTSIQIIIHLYDTCAHITANDVKENDKSLHLAYEPSSTFENLIDQVENAVDFAFAGNSPNVPKQIVTAACNLIHEIGTYGTYYKDWRVLLDNE